MFHLLLVFLILPCIWGKNVEYTWDIGWVTASPDGFARPVIGINGKWPCPMIEVDFGDVVTVRVHNSLGNASTSIHWHGISMNGTSVYDGAVGTTQCAIGPGENYTYHFAAKPAGTHWYHSHYQGQFPDGLRGKLIVHEHNWEVSEGFSAGQEIITVSDWYHELTDELNANYLSDPNGSVPVPDAMLVNDGMSAPTISLKPGESKLIRLISFAALICVYFNVEEHQMTVVAMDGVPIVGEVAKDLIICAGQRYDVVIRALDSPTTNYKYILKMGDDEINVPYTPTEAHAHLGTIDYATWGNFSSTTFNGKLDKSYYPASFFNEIPFTPLDGTTLFVDDIYTIEMNIREKHTPDTVFQLGEQPWRFTNPPTLYEAISADPASRFETATYNPDAVPFIVGAHQTVQIHVNNEDSDPHPLHLHGHRFQICAREQNSTWNGSVTFFQSAPGMRDTVIVPSLGYLVIRFRADNPGAWLFHCHIDLHLVTGMAVTIIESPDQVAAREQIPPSGSALCKTGNREANKRVARGPPLPFA